MMQLLPTEILDWVTPKDFDDNLDDLDELHDLYSAYLLVCEKNSKIGTIYQEKNYDLL